MENGTTLFRLIAQTYRVREPLRKAVYVLNLLLLRDVNPHFLHRIHSEWVDRAGSTATLTGLIASPAIDRRNPSAIASFRVTGT